MVILIFGTFGVIKDTEPAIDIVMIFVEGHDVVTAIDELKIGKFLLVDTEDIFVMLLFFLLL